jgi:hypothetical protein
MAMRTAIVLTSVLFASAAVAGELPKEGKFSGTFHGAGTFKAATMGKDTISGWDQMGYWLITDGPQVFDHMTWHCLGEYHAAGVVGYHGNCIGTDMAGDQMESLITNVDATTPADAKTIPGKGSLVGGTGKYAGISGSITEDVLMTQFKVAADGNYVQFTKFQGSYKLP